MGEVFGLRVSRVLVASFTLPYPLVVENNFNSFCKDEANPNPLIKVSTAA